MEATTEGPARPEIDPELAEMEQGFLRRMARAAPGPPERAARSHARLGRAKPVKSRAQVAIELHSAIRAELRHLKLSQLQGECPEIKFVLGLRTVWNLSQASTVTIHAIPGLGPARRKKVYDYLTSKNVPVSWRP
jgi:hypothetical protein